MSDQTKLFTGRLVVLFMIIALLGFVGVSHAKSSGGISFTGSWSGKGTVRHQGKRHSISCRVRNTNKVGKVYYSTFRCNIPNLGKGSLTILVTQKGKNRYTGSFVDEHSTTRVRLSATQRGKRMRVNISSSRWKGHVNLNKR